MKTKARKNMYLTEFKIGRLIRKKLLENRRHDHLAIF